MNFLKLSVITSRVVPPTVTFYVASSGTDGAAGTLANPWKTVTYAVNNAPAGAVILLNRGDVFREYNIPASKANVRISAYGSGNKPAIIGSSLVTGTWTNVSGNVWSVALASSPTQICNVSAYTLDNITRLTKNTSTPTTPGTGEWGHSAGTLYVNSTTDPNAKIYEANTFNSNNTNTIINVSANNVTLENLSLLMANRNCAVFGLGVKGGYLQDSDLFGACNDCCGGDSGVNPPKDIYIQRNRIYYSGDGSARGTGGTGDGVSFHGYGATDVASCFVLDNDIRYHQKSGVGNQHCVNSVIRRNYIHTCYNPIGIYTVTGATEPVTHEISYNFMYCTSIDQRGVSFTSATNLSADVKVKIWNNTIIGTKTSSYSSINIAQSNRITWDIVNNMISGWSRGIEVGSGADYNNFLLDRLDYNCLYNNTTSYWDNSTGNLAARDGSNNIIDVDPKFNNAATLDYTLMSNSPCLNAGALLGLYPDLLKKPVPYGAAPDIGCYERQS